MTDSRDRLTMHATLRPFLARVAPALLVVAGLGAATAAAEDADPPPVVDPAPATSSGVEGAGVEGAEALLARVVPHVEAACGRTFPERPRVVLSSAAAAAAMFRLDLGAEIARRYHNASEAQRRTLLDLAASASVASCLARYSWSEKAIVIVRSSFEQQRAAAGFKADDAADLLLAILAHESVHALDDAYRDLGGLYAGAPDSEALRARAMVAEGRAVHFGRVAAAAAGASARARDLLPGGSAPSDVRAWTLRLTYEAGAAFVAALIERGGTRLADRALVEPPATTHAVFHPRSWPDASPDERAAVRLRAAGLGESATTLSELRLRARYTALHGRAKAAHLFDGYRGGSQVLVDATNVSVLAFADAESAEAYVEVAASEAPTERHGSLVLRAFGPAADALLERLR